MKKMDIKKFEITKEMYNRAKEVENLFEITKKLDCRSEKFRKLNNKVIKLEEKFEEEVCDEFLTLEIVNEYERREKNKKKMNIKELEITKEMYNDAKRVENAWKLSEENEYFDIWVQDDKAFKLKYGNDFDTLEIVNEYERRETNADRLLTKDQNVYKFTYQDGRTRKFKFYSCHLDKENKKLYTLSNNIYGNLIPDICNVKHIKDIKCIERNNNLDYQ